MADRQMKYLTEKLYPYMWYKLKFVEELPGLPVSNTKTAPLSVNLIEVLRKSIWVHKKISIWHWVPFLKKYFKRMTESSKLYVTYVTFIMYTAVEGIQGDTYEQFITACSIVTAVAAYAHENGRREFVDYTPTILMVFFKDILEKPFYSRGGWKRLEQYLVKQDYYKWYDDMEPPSTDETATQKLRRELGVAKNVERKVKSLTGDVYYADDFTELEVEFHTISNRLTATVVALFPIEPTIPVGLEQSSESQLVEQSLEEGVGSLRISESTCSADEITPDLSDFHIETEDLKGSVWPKETDEIHAVPSSSETVLLLNPEGKVHTKKEAIRRIGLLLKKLKMNIKIVNDILDYLLS